MCMKLGSVEWMLVSVEDRQGSIVSSEVRSSWTVYVSDVRVRVIFIICRTKLRMPDGPYISTFGYQNVT